MANTIFDDEAGNLATISKDPSFPTTFFEVRLNHIAGETADGGRITYDVGPTKIAGNMIWKNVVASEANALRTFLKTRAEFSKNPFTINISDFSNLDIGAGAGVNLTTVHFPNTSLKNIFKPRPPGNFDITLPYVQDPT